MPKQKTNKAARKRFKITKSGKVKYVKAGRRHILGKKSRKRKRKLRKAGFLNKTQARQIRRLLPYG
jgi:large subunit ribosomal protein L35